jgi:D-ornithine 4,5-aminomutase subunit alpha
MTVTERESDFEQRRHPLRELSDRALHERFWQLVDRIVAPLVEEAREHTTPAIERSVLLRMGFTGAESKTLVDEICARGLLGHGAGRLIFEHARRRGIAVREAGLGLMGGEGWEDLRP